MLLYKLNAKKQAGSVNLLVFAYLNPSSFNFA